MTNMETGHVGTYRPGDFILEAVRQWHMGAIIGAEPLKLLVIDIVEKGQTNTVLQIRDTIRHHAPRPTRPAGAPGGLRDLPSIPVISISDASARSRRRVDPHHSTMACRSGF